MYHIRSRRAAHCSGSAAGSAPGPYATHLVLAVVVPAVVGALSFASGRSRCHQHPKAGPGRASGALEAAVTTLILAVYFSGRKSGGAASYP
jgi:hypothetical protein